MSSRTTRRAVTTVIAVLAAVAALCIPVVGPGQPSASAADLARFDPGTIISDAVFYDAAAMSAAQIQSFIGSKGASCAPAAGNTCLKDYRETTWTRPADTRCTGTYTGAANETAGQIIGKVAVACGINPQVLLVTLQKEQGLVTATAGRSAAVYQKAMGFGCPDTAACDAKYYGFFNQVYNAAHQFQNYTKNPSGYAHRAGMVNQVRFHPNAACGTSPVLIANQATANLYNYTPYQPNAAALAAGYGTGDACSSYGNRNFWNYFTDWFGTTLQRQPLGHLDGISSPAPGTIQVSGWALDPDTTAPIQVHAYVDGAPAAVIAADRARPDVGAVYGKGDNHGFVASIGASNGNHQVCLFAMDSSGGPNTQFACASVLVLNQPPLGYIDGVTSPSTGTIRVKGWALDPDTNDSVAVHVYVDGSHRVTLTASDVRKDVAAVYGRGEAHGFTTELGASNGQHEVCVYGIDTAGGSNTRLGCTIVSVRNQVPIGSVDRVTVTGKTAAVRGWALDPDTSTSVAVHVYVDGAFRSTSTASDSRPDVGLAHGLGDAHGFTVPVALADGAHQICVYAIDTSGGTNPVVGCRQVVIRNEPPVGALDAVTPGMEQVTVRGWALDPDTTDPIAVHVYIDGVHRGTATANETRTDVGAVYGKGDAHGYTLTLPATPGQREICVWAIDATGGTNPRLACASVYVNGYAFGAFDTVTATAGAIRARGWAIDPDTRSPIGVHVYVDAVGTAATANVARPDVDTVYGMGPNHGFDVTTAAAPGPHQVCAYAIDYPGGTNPLLGCKAVSVP